ncbi:MAG: LysM peptidoglycan-binding domain-containing protein [Bacteroidales bacterium]|nr:LysM peptidoglycan-binding domain-containing protein [Bacteroidales bacterium]
MKHHGVSLGIITLRTLLCGLVWFLTFPVVSLKAAERPSARQRLAASQEAWQLSADRQQRRALEETAKDERQHMLSLLSQPRPWVKWLPLDSLPEGFELLPLLLSEGNTASRGSYTAGLWGLTEAVAMKYGLTISSNYDERLDPERATRAVVRYWRDLDRLYHSPWQTLLALVNTPAAYENAARRLRSRQFWDFADLPVLLYADFPRQWASLLYWAAYAPGSPAPLAEQDSALAEVCLSAPLSLALLCQQLPVQEVLFRQQNPCILSGDCLDAGSRIRLSPSQAVQFEEQQAVLYARTGERLDKEREARYKAARAAMVPLTYTVRSGDTLGAIARRYHVTLSDLMRWNQLRSDRIYIGQKLRIHKS